MDTGKADVDTESGPVVVGVDSSQCACDAARWAARLAAVWRAPLHLVHVVEPPVTEVPPWLGELLDATEAMGSAPPRAELRTGAVVDALAEGAVDARMLVLGSYGDGARSGMLAGTVALTLLDRVGCPLAVVRGPGPQLPPPFDGPVVVGVDGSPAGRAALDLAAGMAVSLDAGLVAVHTWSEMIAGERGATRRPEKPSVLAAQSRALLAAELQAVTVAHPGLRVEHVAIHDTPIRVLLDRARGARMVVVGHRGHSCGSGMLAGSTSRALVQFAQCPVVVTRPSAAAPGAR